MAAWWRSEPQGSWWKDQKDEQVWSSKDRACLMCLGDQHSVQQGWAACLKVSTAIGEVEEAWTVHFASCWEGFDSYRDWEGRLLEDWEKTRAALVLSAKTLSGWSVVCRRWEKKVQRQAGGLNVGFALILLKYDESLEEGDGGVGGISRWILGRFFQNRRNVLALCCRALSWALSSLTFK